MAHKIVGHAHGALEFTGKPLDKTRVVRGGKGLPRSRRVVEELIEVGGGDGNEVEQRAKDSQKQYDILHRLDLRTHGAPKGQSAEVEAASTGRFAASRLLNRRKTRFRHAFPTIRVKS
jgi:hypothetical protein